MSFQDMVSALGLSEGASDRIVPPSGGTAHVLFLAAIATSFLAVFALALSLAAGRVSDRWSTSLAQSATVRIVAPVEDQAALAETTLRILETTSGVAFARAFEPEEQRALLTPWFGPDLDLGLLPVPKLIEVIQNDGGFDAEGLRLRLAAEVPGAVLDDHGQWRAPLVHAANRLKALGIVSMFFLIITVTSMVTLAARAALAANAQVISVLRLVGATDQFIAIAFVRRFTFRAFIGASIGMVIGLCATLLLPSASDTGGILTGLGFKGLQWLLPVLIPLLAAIVAFVATGLSARQVMRELP
ncbi:MAG: cell division protein FtsX [Roseobacter sp.]